MIFALKVIVLGYKQFYMNIYLQEKRMNLNNYFDFLAPDDIRIKGHRIGI